jgi:tetratricopeptide (TPR) repeat protein
MSDPLDEDVQFGKLAVAQGLCSRAQAEECLELLRKLHAQGMRPLPRLAGLLLQKGYLGKSETSRTVALDAPAPLPGRDAARTEIVEGPLNVRAALEKPENLVGKYVRVHLLGVGGMGEVWKAWDRELRRWVALKFLKHSDPKDEARFRAEAQAAAGLQHPNICAVHEVGRHEGRPFIALQYVEGTTLQAVRRGDRMALVRIFRDVALAVQRAHEAGIVHRDLKPANVMVDGRGGVVVMDFGLAKSTAVDSSVSVSGSVVGTPAYMSPEQALGSKDVDGRADVYSLGATMYEVLGGEPVFAGSGVYDLLIRIANEEPKPLRKKWPQFDAELETIVMKCLEKDRQRRYATAAELAEDLRRWLDREPILAHPPSFLYKFRKRLAKHKALTGLVVLGVVGAVAAAVIIPRYREAQRDSDESRANYDKEYRRATETERAREAAAEFLESGRRLLGQIERRLGERDFGPAERRALAEHAAAQFRLALEKYALLPEARVALARLAELLGDRKAALAELERAVQESPQFAAAYLDRVRLLLQDYEELRRSPSGGVRDEGPEARQLRDRVEADLKAAARHSRQPAELLYARALLAYGSGDFAAAEKSLAEYLFDVPADSQAHAWRGQALARLGRFKEADDELGASLRYDARAPGPLKSRAAVRLRLGDLDSARKDLDDVIALEPTSAFSFIQRGVLREAQADAKGALADYEASLKLKLTWQAYDRIGLLAVARGDLDSALNQFAAAIPLADGPSATGLILRHLALARFRQGHAAVAEDLAGRSLRAVPDDPDALALRAEIRSALDRKADAAADLRRALEKASPDWPGRPAADRRLRELGTP